MLSHGSDGKQQGALFGKRRQGLEDREKMGDGVVGMRTEAADGCLASAGIVRDGIIACVVGEDPFEQLNGESGVRVTSREFMKKRDKFP